MNQCLYITKQGSFVSSVAQRIKVDKQEIPIHNLNMITSFGNIIFSPSAIKLCVKFNKPIIMLNYYGKFITRISGEKSENVLLKKAQFTMSEKTSLLISKQIIYGKIQNSRNNIMRAARDDADNASSLYSASDNIYKMIRPLLFTKDLNELRGVEGFAARIYFECFSKMIKQQKEKFIITERNRRPPKDFVNAMLSFSYSLLLSDCISALESADLNYQVGILHSIRPGRPALALDLMEEFRPIMDKMVLSLINRKQITENNFEQNFLLNESGKKIVLNAYSKKKREKIEHKMLGNKIMFGLIPIIQAHALAKTIRNENNKYMPFVTR